MFVFGLLILLVAFLTLYGDALFKAATTNIENDFQARGATEGKAVSQIVTRFQEIDSIKKPYPCIECNFTSPTSVKNEEIFIVDLFFKKKNLLIRYISIKRFV